MLRYSILLLCLYYTVPAIGQRIVTGTVTDGKKIPLAFVNIGIRHKNIGTVSTEDGKFEIQIPDQYEEDTLSFSIVGYKEVSVAVIDAIPNMTVSLQENATLLNEVTIASKKLIEKKYGIHKHNSILNFTDGSTQQNDVFEIGQQIRLENTPTKIKSLCLHINEPRKDSGTFRINFYKYVNNRPAERVVEKSIIQTKAIQPGWMHFDLSPYNIYMQGNIVAAIEFIPNKKKSSPIYYEIKPGGRDKSFVRTNSLGTWQVPPHQYRMYVTALTTGEKRSKQEDEEKEILPAFSVFTQIVNDSFSIFVKLPANYKHSNKTYPVKYILDANLYFPYLHDTLEKFAKNECILVGIGYRNFIEMDSLRDRDYTYPIALATDSFSTSGGGDKFYEFISNELTTYIDNKYRTDIKNRTLMGHSLGGYFTLYALHKDMQEGKQIFKNYVAASPSLEYYNQYLLQQFKTTAYNTHPSKNLYITYGSVEEYEDGFNYGQLIEAFAKQAEALKIKTEKEVFSGAGHMEAALPAFYNALNKY